MLRHIYQTDIHPAHDNERNYHELMRIVRTVRSPATLRVLQKATRKP